MLTLFLVMFLALVPVIQVHAGGAREDPLEEARQLVDDQEYDKAILLLSAVLRDDPDRRDEVEALLVRIREFKSRYNLLFSQLNDTLVNEPDNYEKSLGLINQMLELDPNPSEKSRARLESARITAKLQVDRAARNRILEEARRLLALKDYTGAMEVYARGFELQRADFLLGTQSEDFRKRTIDMVDHAKSAVEAYRSKAMELRPGLEAFAAVVSSGELADPGTEFSKIASLYLGTVSYPVSLENDREASLALKEESDKTYPDYVYNEYIRFLRDFIAGPVDADNEGIAWSARRDIDSLYQDTLSALDDFYLQTRAQMEAAFREDRPDDLAGLLPVLRERGRLRARAMSLRSGRDPGLAPGLDSLTGLAGKDFAGPANQVLLDVEAWSFLVEVTRVVQSFRTDNVPGAWSKVLADHDVLRDMGARWTRDEKSWAGLPGLDDGTRSGAREVFLPYLEENRTRMMDAARADYLNIVSADAARVSDPHAGYAGRLAEAMTLLDGASGQAAASVRRYPSRALALFRSMENDLKSWISSASGLESRMAVERQELVSHVPAAKVRNDNRTLKLRMDEELAALGKQIADAEDRIRQSGQLKNLAQQMITQGRTWLDLRRLDIARAEKAYNDAFNLYARSFDLSWDDADRSDADARLLSFRQEMESARQARLVEDINKKLDEAKSFFDRELYGPAQDSIADAEDLFRQTTEYLRNPKARNQDITYLKGRIMAARTLNQETTISEADPEFATLNGQIQSAFLAYQSVRTLMGNKKPDAAALAEIAKARGYVESVLSVRPANRDAKLLQLRLEQLSDPDGFQERFRLRYQQAVNRSKENPSVEVLTDLQALQEINPKYAGISDAILRLQISLGLRENPVDVAQRREAARLVRQAQELSRSRDSEQLNRALSLLADALALDRENKDARNLANDIRKRMGGITAILSRADQELYNQAESLYVQRKYTEALALTSRLLLKPDNRLFDPLVKLDGLIKRDGGFE